MDLGHAAANNIPSFGGGDSAVDKAIVVPSRLSSSVDQELYELEHIISPL